MTLALIAFITVLAWSLEQAYRQARASRLLDRRAGIYRIRSKLVDEVLTGRVDPASPATRYLFDLCTVLARNLHRISLYRLIVVARLLAQDAQFRDTLREIQKDFQREENREVAELHAQLNREVLGFLMLKHKEILALGLVVAILGPVWNRSKALVQRIYSVQPDGYVPEYLAAHLAFLRLRAR